ncbi:MAG: hypothetical protein MRY79_01420 [Alphaproteobacteria bacterium]|nr:hypothetical protein [Alphaproteobacteria bacterium]
MRILPLLLLFFWAVLPMNASAQSLEGQMICGVLAAQHKPSAGVAYKGGVDVHGKAVVPADLNVSPIMPPEVIKIPLTIDLSKRIQTFSDQPLNTDSALGMIDVHSDGRVMYNGRDVAVPLKTACGIIKPEPQEVLVEVEEDVPPTTITKIITHQPDLIPQGAAEIIEGGDFRE